MELLLKILPYMFTVGGILIVVGLYKGKVEDVVEKCKDLPEWRSRTDVRLTLCEDNDKNQSQLLAEINKNLIKIGAVVDLLVDNRIKESEDK